MKSEKFLEVLRRNNKVRSLLPCTEEVMQRIIDLHHQGYTYHDIAEVLGVAHHVIVYRAHLLGLKTHSGVRSQLHAVKRKAPYMARQRAEALEPLIRDCFLNKGMSAVDVGKLCNLDYSTIIDYARLLDIPVQTRAQAAAKRRGQLNITPELLEILDGELLGDGCIPKPHTSSAFFTYMTPRQKYLHWLSLLLQQHGLDGKIYGPRKMPSSQPSYQYSSKWYPELYDLRQRWYPEGKKIVPRDLVLTPTACRHWYLGDGSMRQPPQAPYIIMCTHGFTHADVEFLASLVEPFAPGVRVGKPVTAGPPLWFPKKAALAFLDYIGECPNGIREVYGYKWRLPMSPQLSLWKYGTPMALT